MRDVRERHAQNEPKEHQRKTDDGAWERRVHYPNQRFVNELKTKQNCKCVQHRIAGNLPRVRRNSYAIAQNWNSERVCAFPLLQGREEDNYGLRSERSPQVV